MKYNRVYIDLTEATEWKEPQIAIRSESNRDPMTCFPQRWVFDYDQGRRLLRDLQSWFECIDKPKILYNSEDSMQQGNILGA